MHKLGLGLVVLGTLATTAAADNFHQVVTSNGAFALFDATSADGCVHASGVFYTDQTPDGPIASIIAPAYDSCTGSSGWFIGGGPATTTADGLRSATASGTVVAWDYTAQMPDITFDFSLAFRGTGRTITETSHGTSASPGGNVTMSFSSSRRRAATVSGTMTMDGGPASFGEAFLGAGISGDLSIAH